MHFHSCNRSSHSSRNSLSNCHVAMEQNNPWHYGLATSKLLEKPRSGSAVPPPDVHAVTLMPVMLRQRRASRKTRHVPRTNRRQMLSRRRKVATPRPKAAPRRPQTSRPTSRGKLSPDVKTTKGANVTTGHLRLSCVHHSNMQKPPLHLM